MGCMDPITVESLEADARRLMSERSRIEDRGFNTARARQVLMDQIDAKLDAWNAATTLLAHEFEAAS